MRPYTAYAGPGAGGDGAVFFAGTLVAWFPHATELSAELPDGFIVFSAMDYTATVADGGFGHIIKDGDDRSSIVVTADEFSFLPDVLSPLHYRYDDAFGALTHSTRLDLLTTEDDYASRPGAHPGRRFLFEVYNDIHGLTRAANLRPVSGGPRG